MILLEKGDGGQSGILIHRAHVLTKITAPFTIRPFQKKLLLGSTVFLLRNKGKTPLPLGIVDGARGAGFTTSAAGKAFFRLTRRLVGQQFLGKKESTDESRNSKEEIGTAFPH